MRIHDFKRRFRCRKRAKRSELSACCKSIGLRAYNSMNTWGSGLLLHIHGKLFESAIQEKRITRFGFLERNYDQINENYSKLTRILNDLHSWR